MNNNHDQMQKIRKQNYYFVYKIRWINCKKCFSPTQISTLKKLQFPPTLLILPTFCRIKSPPLEKYFPSILSKQHICKITIVRKKMKHTKQRKKYKNLHSMKIRNFFLGFCKNELFVILNLSFSFSLSLQKKNFAKINEFCV